MAELYVIIGLGLTGLSCARYLKAQNIPFVLMDTRLHPPKREWVQATYPDVPLICGHLDKICLQRATKIILSPGVCQENPDLDAAKQRGVPIIGDVELFAQIVQEPVIAITGTNAKSTVTTLVGMMAKAAGYHVQVGGNLGIPVLDLLMADAKTNLFVLELSSFQLETLSSLKPAVAAILNISPDHMDRYHDLSAYQQAKQRIYYHAETIVYNGDDELTYVPSHYHSKFSYAFTLNCPKKNEFGILIKNDQAMLAYEEKPLIATKSLPLAGEHAMANALAALAIGHGMGFPMDTMLSVLATFKGLPHRCQLIKTYQGVQWYNDSKGTNVGATLAAIKGLGKYLSGKLVLILGGVGKQADFSPLIPAIKHYVRHVILIGEAAEILYELLHTHVASSFAFSMQEAVQQALAYAKPNDRVLLSPACASFDMFDNYEHRGDVFSALVNQLGE